MSQAKGHLSLHRGMWGSTVEMTAEGEGGNRVVAQHQGKEKRKENQLNVLRFEKVSNYVKGQGDLETLLYFGKEGKYSKEKMMVLICSEKRLRY